ncbi:transcriptional regulator CynR [Thioalkalivibrio thiocyanodenitrificans]|uniref:transcriptional regulator CynR n=1 Tax=Thioalkalivibrio thiocyanodenitrificans TaxID=243063 RepID=UPI000A049E0D|nr:transcriptional regulator CynR [Thioalkalivibrio thiocyanodenitrificans]
MDRRVIFPRCLQYLLAIAEYGSYTRAAEALHVSQPTLSQQIKQLEASLGTLLVNRSARNIRLTDAGEIYLGHARRAWGELDAGTRAISDVQDLSRGLLRLGWTPITDYLTCSLLISYNNLYPGITLSTFEMPQDDVEAAVAEDDIDVGIVFSVPLSTQPASSNVKTEMLFKEDLFLAISHDHPRAKQRQGVSVREFSQEALILLNTNFELRRHIDLYCHDLDILPRIAMETDSLSVIIKMVQSGQLASVLPRSIVRTQYGICGIRISPQLPPKAITIICRKNGYKSPACRAFTALALDWAAHRDEHPSSRRSKPCALSEKHSLYEDGKRRTTAKGNGSGNGN